jgi:glycerol uptake facilitator-like aquaporin
MSSCLPRRLAAELGGTGFLVAAVVGSGFMAERLSQGNVAVALLANTLATGAALVALILALGPVSGAHLNPVVTLAVTMEGGLRTGEAVSYVCAQIAGGVGGTIAAHLMFGLPVLSLSHHARSGAAQLFGEFVATFGLLAVILACIRFRAHGAAYAVGATSRQPIGLRHLRHSPIQR